MAIINSRIDPDSTDFAANSAHMRGLVEDLQKHLDQVERGGGEKSCARHTKRGKMLPRERIRQLIDPGTPFLELSPMAAHGMYDGKSPSAGIITGLGRVSGQEVVIIANDATVKGGSYMPITEDLKISSANSSGIYFQPYLHALFGFLNPSHIPTVIHMGICTTSITELHETHIPTIS